MTETQKYAPRLLVSVQLEQDISEAEAIVRALSHRRWHIVLLIEQSLLGLARVDLKRLVDLSGEVHVNVQGHLHSWFAELILSCDGALFITETSHPYHRLNYLLCQEANRVGVLTVTLQHGLENIGLTQSDAQNPINTIGFASRHVLSWVREPFLHPEISPEVKAKIHHVGLVPLPVSGSESSAQKDHPSAQIGIFESLHRGRYSEERRTALVGLIDQAINACPEVRFLCVSHPIGRWMEQNRPLVTQNLSYYQGTDRLKGHQAREQMIESLTAALVTPSTVVVDLTLRQQPFILLGALEGHEHILYRGFFRVEDGAQLREAIRTAMSPQGAGEVINQHYSFLREVCGHFDGAREVALFLERAIGSRGSERQLRLLPKEEFLSTESEVRSHFNRPTSLRYSHQRGSGRGLRVAIYGTGFAGRRLRHSLPDRIEVSAYLDLRVGESERQIDGVGVLRPSKEVLEAVDYVFVSAQSVQFVREQLQERGMPAERIICFNSTQ